MLNAQTIRGDLVGGITAAAVALPLALAFGVASGLGPLAGIYGAVLVGFFAAVFGGTNSQISGPTGPMTVVIAAVFTYFNGDVALTCTVIMLAGVLQILFGVAGFGRYIKLVPQPVISGFMTGIGLIVIILQIGPLLGYDSPEGTNLVKLTAAWDMIAQPNYSAVFLGVLSFILVTILPKLIGRFLPPTLLALVVGTLIGVFFLPQAPVIGEIPVGLPDFHLPALSLNDTPALIRFGLTLTFLGSIDSLLTSLAADSITRTHHDSNKELIGQGIGNLAAGFAGGVPGAGATMRTFINIRSGGTTRLSGSIHALVLLLLMGVFAAEVSHIPLAVLGGILLKVGIDIIDWRNLQRLHRAPGAGVAIMLTTLTLTVFVDLVTAVAVGIVMASVLFVARLADAQMETVKSGFGASDALLLSAEESLILDKIGENVLLLQMEGPLSFASARDITKIMHQTRSNDVLIIDLSKVPFIDGSAAASLEEATEDLLRNGDYLVIFGAHERVLKTLGETDVVNLIGNDKIVTKRLDALLIAQELLRQ